MLVGDRRRPTRASLGTASLSISSLLVFSSTDKFEKPVTLSPGRARLATKSEPTGVRSARHYDGRASSCFLRRRRGRIPCGHDQINLETNQVGSELRQVIPFSFSKPV